MANNLTTTVYHHTNEEGEKGIFESGFIKQADRKNGDAVYGTGVYVCRKGPEYSKEEIAKNNYDGSTSFYQQQIDKGKANVVLEIEYERSKVIPVDADGRDVCKIETNIPVRNIKQVHYR